MNNSNREFRKIKSLDFLYEINDNGTIFRNVKSKKQSKIVLDFHHSKSGYYFVFINRNKKTYRIPIARIVAECWIGEKPDGYEIDHIDRNSRNNDYRNLRYVTKSEQMKNRDHTRIAARGKENLDAFRRTIMKPVSLVNGDGVLFLFESIINSAKFLSWKYCKPVEHMRQKLKKRRQRIYDYDVIFGM